MHALRELARLAAVAAIGIVLVVAYTTLRILQQGDRDEQRPAGAIVVLGAAQYDGRPSPVFAARLDHAVALYVAGLAPYLVVTGGQQVGDRTTEAAVARAYAEAHGVPASAILAEDRGHTTLESLAAVGPLLRQHGIRDALFVSDRPHMLRVLRMAADQGIVAWGSPTPSSPLERDVRRRVDATIHEIGALALYFVAGQAPADELRQPRP
jgi:uncharacterized SAM-binding protein YcdF (DUF218 family)